MRKTQDFLENSHFGFDVLEQCNQKQELTNGLRHEKSMIFHGCATEDKTQNAERRTQNRAVEGSLIEIRDRGIMKMATDGNKS